MQGLTVLRLISPLLGPDVVGAIIQLYYGLVLSR